MKKHLLILLLVCVVCALLPGCYFNFNFNKVGTWRNKTIDEDVRNEIDVLDKKLFKGIMTQDVKAVKKLMAEGLIKKKGKTVDSVVTEFGALFKAKDYRLLDEFYCKSATENTNHVLQSDKENNNDYKIEFLALNKETYVSVMVSTNLPVNCLILAIYGKYETGWKLNILRIGEYSVMDQTAPEYYDLAVNQFTKGNIVDAVDMIVMAARLAYPAGDYLIYKNDYEMKDTYSVILKDAGAKYKLPYIINEVKTKPAIFAIGPLFISDPANRGIFPLVRYQSSIPISDTIALKAENQNVQKAIGGIFKGIDKNKYGIIYDAYNSIPDSLTPGKYFTILQKLKYGKE
ncbi:hypothetical protein BDD43_3491 [Mucilaginibacter gracilis]|uniref:Uncharacterized protein n=1 Tax=Mucilaginibacter gracilis TaxID=423350 RepID=A0A495J2Y2_9SPHI|nr:hypothetical protein [Mucilaginibacter gracilis]RKR83287.1 hypothetical protein BDD43_3491 [Mucilaginibacter gracilis]